MKTLVVFLLIAALKLVAPFETSAEATQAIAVGSTNGATTLSWVIIPAEASSVPIVTYLNATSDKAASVVQSYLCTALTTANYANTTVSLPVASTNGFASGDVIVIRHMGNPQTYEKRAVTTYTSGTNLTVTVAPLQAVAVGDVIYRMTTSGAAKIPVGAATLALNGTGILAGQSFQGNPVPLLLEVDATTSGTLNSASATYQAPAGANAP